MSRSSRLIAGIAVTLLFAACGQAGDSLTGPDGPRLNSGYSTGGNRAEGDSTVTTQSAGSDATVASDSLGRGGYSTGGN